MSLRTRAGLALVLSGYFCLARGQFSANHGLSSNSLRGEVECQPPLNPTQLLVELVDSTRHVAIDRTPLSPTGSFEFRHVPNGAMEVRVINFQGDVLKREWVQAENISWPVTIRVGRPAERPVSGLVTPYRLQHKVPKKAMTEFVKAARALEEQRFEEAEQRLRKAIAMDPGFVEAYNNLGVRLAKEGKLEEAAEQFVAASKLDPHSTVARENLRIIHAHLVEGRKAAPANSFTR
ncbi:MAG: tetratricopeptide repeat protein [Bryobacterales bacterium]|nr:tetratricopeptide repeat protein [Bryobacterales bacterium]